LQVSEEMVKLGRITGPMVLMSLLLYLKGMVSTMFLGYLGELELAGGSLSMGFANITGYSLISGLAMGMEPICGQAFGAKRWSLLGLTLQRTVLVLLCATVPIGLLWCNMKPILLLCGQDKNITSLASTYIVFSLPDLITQAFLQPLRIYLRTQNITVPLTWSAAIALLLHIPINFLLVEYLKMGIRGVALAAVWTSFNTVFSLLCYLYLSGVYKKSWQNAIKRMPPRVEMSSGLALPSCASVCLEWWWYEIMIILCGLLLDPKATVAAMGILIQATGSALHLPFLAQHGSFDESRERSWR
jgi:MATE family multidrug resistance protein